MLHAGIMAGGSGTRFWPKSRERTPKQLIHIAGEGTMIQQTLARLTSGIDASRIYIITTASQEQATRDQVPQLPLDNIIAEPMGRDSAACIGLAAIIARKNDPEAVILMCPADHIIRPPERFMKIVKTAAEIVSDSGNLGTFGIKPTFPSTGYGYIHRGNPIETRGDVPAYKVGQFVEKPDLEKAKEFLASGEYYWNSGLFVWTADAILQAIEKHMPELHQGLRRMEPALGTPQQTEAIRREYEPLQKISIDYGVMEKADNVIVLEADYEWDDVGSWLAIERLYDANESGNVIVGAHEGIKTRNCTVMTEPGHMVATIGVSDLVIVHTPDATLVCSKQDAADVKQLVENLKRKGLRKYL
ncbi:MAG: NTP transferase domain-containing protein [Planctomycetes bacterium]|nr:NTP transferase domain-containing protein [Planctomycetota bacterium]